MSTYTVFHCFSCAEMEDVVFECSRSYSSEPLQRMLSPARACIWNSEPRCRATFWKIGAPDCRSIYRRIHGNRRSQVVRDKEQCPVWGQRWDPFSYCDNGTIIWICKYMGEFETAHFRGSRSGHRYILLAAYKWNKMRGLLRRLFHYHLLSGLCTGFDRICEDI